MALSILHVVSATISSQEELDSALRHLRRLAPGGAALLLLADFAPSPARRLPEDALLLRALQSGVMAMNERVPGRFALLWRERVWDDAARQYGAPPLCARETIAQLMAQGRSRAIFAAATVAPASLRDRYDAVLFSDVSLSCMPDTPARMADALAASSGGLGARVLVPRVCPETVFAHLLRSCGFALTPLRAAREALLARENRCPAENPAMFAVPALIDSLLAPPASLPIAGDCFFVRLRAPALSAVFRAHRAHALRHADADAFLPAVQLALLLLSAALGKPLLWALALAPEALAVLRPRLLPGAMLRTALLPLTALASLDAALCRMLARSRLLRLRVPRSLTGMQSGVLFGAATLAMAVASAGALVPLLPLCLLWLAAPLLLPALDHPTLERIPLDEDERARMRSLAESAYFDAAQPPALSMLSACAGAMLGLLEADEAARQADALLAQSPQAATAAEQAALLTSAQYLREQMARCDAALRDLPARIEAHVRALPPPEGSGLLSAFLRVARSGEPDALAQLRQSAGGAPLDALFLPLGPAKEMTQHALSLPLTHPHTFLKRQLLASAQERVPFLSLCAGALGHPFYALLMRSPAAQPYTALLWV